MSSPTRRRTSSTGWSSTGAGATSLWTPRRWPRSTRAASCWRSTRRAAARLPEPAPSPPALAAGPDDVAPDGLGDKLRRAWDYVSGNY